MLGIIHTSGAVYPDVPIGSYKNKKNSARERKKREKGSEMENDDMSEGNN